MCFDSPFDTRHKFDGYHLVYAFCNGPLVEGFCQNQTYDELILLKWQAMCDTGRGVYVGEGKRAPGELVYLQISKGEVLFRHNGVLITANKIEYHIKPTPSPTP